MVPIKAITSKLGYTEEAEMTPAVTSGEYRRNPAERWGAGRWQQPLCCTGSRPQLLEMPQARSAPCCALSTRMPAPPVLGSCTSVPVARLSQLHVSMEKMPLAVLADSAPAFGAEC